MKLAAEGELDAAADTLRLTKAHAERDGLTVDASGSLTKLSTVQEIGLTGTLVYDLSKLTPQLRKAVGGEFQASGTGSKAFRLSGPLADLSGEAGLGWQSVHAYGFDVGAGTLDARMARGVLTTNAIEAGFGGGKVRLTPTVRFAPAPAELTLEKGKVVDHAKLTPRACTGAVGYALPVVANAAQVEGEVSLILEDNRIPLHDTTQAAVKGSSWSTRRRWAPVRSSPRSPSSSAPPPRR